METITAILRAAPVDCWSCGCETLIISSVTLDRGTAGFDCSVADFTDWPDLIERLVGSLPPSHGIGVIKPRVSKTAGHAYMSNGCRHCDAIFGQHYEVHTRYDENVVAEVELAELERWELFLAAQPE